MVIKHHITISDTQHRAYTRNYPKNNNIKIMILLTQMDTQTMIAIHTVWDVKSAKEQRPNKDEITKWSMIVWLD